MVRVNREKCLRCSGCVSVCPKTALCFNEHGIQWDKKKCINCGICIKFCPAGALEKD